MAGSYEEEVKGAEKKFKRAGSVVDMAPRTEEEMEAIRYAVATREGLLLSVFDVLRRVPRRVLMVLKLNDLTRYIVPLVCIPN
jgi:aarF domain-containing kinase